MGAYDATDGGCPCPAASVVAAFLRLNLARSLTLEYDTLHRLTDMSRGSYGRQRI